MLKNHELIARTIATLSPKPTHAVSITKTYNIYKKKSNISIS